MRSETERVQSYLRSWAIAPDGPDGELLLRIALHRFGGTNEHEPLRGLPYVRFSMPHPGRGSACVFLLGSAEPALIQRWLDVVYIGVHEGYARAIRVMCLRLAADRRVWLGGCACQGGFTFPAPLTQTPHGAETLWYERIRDVSASGGSRLYPEWYDEALQSLCPCRSSLFCDACIAALSFVVEHEMQHAFGDRSISREHRPNSKVELDADRGALMTLFASGAQSPGVNAAICGVLATFLVFHLKLVLDDLEGVASGTIHWYPSVRERTRQFAEILLCGQGADDVSIPAFALLRHLVEVSSLHPAYACVLGTPWIAEDGSLT